MMSLISLKKLITTMRRGVSRFPLPILASIVVTICLILAVDKGFDEDILIKISLIAGLAFIASLLVELLLEASHAHDVERILSNLGVLLAVGAYGYFFIPHDIDYARPPFWYSYSILIFCLHLGVALTPLRSTKDPERIWRFNLNLFLRFIFSSINAAILFAGLALALLSIDKLFDVGWYEEIYIDTWFLCAFTIHPLLCLGGIARVQELDTDQAFPKALHFSLRFVGLPLTALYLLILYAYVGKIILQWNWPNGWVALPIFILSVISLLAYVLSIPLATSERWASLFKKWLFRLLFPLSLVLIFALQIRLADYGMTINRHLGLTLGLWLFGISLCMLLKPRLHVAWIPGTLLVMALLAIYGGPIGAFGWSERAQVQRIHELGTQLGIYSDGRLVPSTEPKDSDTVKEFSSALRYLFTHFGQASLENELTDYDTSKTSKAQNRRSGYYLSNQVMEYLQIQDDLQNASSYFRFDGDLVPTQGHPWKLAYNFYGYNRNNQTKTYSLGNDSLSFTSEKAPTQLQIALNETELTTIELQTWAEEVSQTIRENGTNSSQPLIWKIEAQGWEFSFVLTSASIQNSTGQFQSATFDVFLSPSE